MTSNAAQIFNSPRALQDRDDGKSPVCFFAALGLTFLYALFVLIIKIRRYVLKKSASVSAEPYRCQNQGLAPGGTDSEAPSRPSTAAGVRAENIPSPSSQTMGERDLAEESVARGGSVSVAGYPKGALMEAAETSPCRMGSPQQSDRNFVILPQPTISVTPAVSEPMSISFRSHFMQNHIWLRTCADQKHILGSLSGIYVTVIGLFLTSGIFLDLMCGCDDKGEDECCQSNYRTISLGAAPFPIALVWLLATKLVDLFLMKNKNNTKAHQKRRTTQRNRRLQQQNKPGDGFRISAVIIIFAMSVIVVAGLVSTSVYSFRFHREVSFAWIEMVVICLVVEGVVMDSLYQVLHYALCLRNVPAEGAESRPEAKEGSLRRV